MIYINGNFLPADQASVQASDRGLLLGDGLFETLLAINGRAMFLKEHWQRMNNGLAILNIPPPFDYPALENIVEQLLIKNQLMSGNATLRLTITRGAGPRGVLPAGNFSPNYFMTASVYSPNPINSFKTIFSSIRRNEYSPTTKLKSINYLDNILARLEADKAGVHDALFLNTQGNVTESTAANIFLVHNQTVFTPPVADGLIPGIIRAVVIDICSQLNIPVKEISITPEALLAAEEVFLTNSLIGIQPVSSIGEHTYPAEPRFAHKIKSYYAFIFDPWTVQALPA